MELEKEGDVTWILPKTGLMRVPVRVFASDKLLAKMKLDRTLLQASNDAALPGIIDALNVMPDGHEGYGFPIGGVAAFDPEEGGVVSPGGVGYDINCLPGETKVLTDSGYKRIADYSTKDKLATKLGERVVFVEPLLFMQKHADAGIRLKTESGRTVVATSEHPILTPAGMVGCGLLSEGALVRTLDNERLEWERVSDIRPESINDFVYDFTVAGTHNFFADGVNVSNCGVRLLATNKTVDELQPNIKELVDRLYANVPVGVGTKSKVRFNTMQLEELVTSGVDFAVSEGYATKRDKEYCEENGRIAGADYSKVSDKAKSRGAPQVGTLGSGNHFIEIQKVDKIYDVQTAKAFGLTQEGQVTVMIHSGSRGFGHQICDDSVRFMLTNAKRNGLELPDPELSAAPLGTIEADDYFCQMNCAVNYAFNNRQFMTHFVRQSFAEALGGDWEDHGLDLVYDVCHNIAKYEEHVVDGKSRNVCVHRKGATRAFWAGRKEIPQAYRSIGQPVIVPGSMNTASYVLCGLPGASVSFGSSCHGAGRAMSRHAALREYDGVKLQKEMEDKGMAVRAPSPKSLAEEAGGAYKDVDEVVATVAKAGISKLVARLTPLGVIKG
ncbi:hypothetical protein AUJ14_03705 [Candidatus Micrarchaeota archaeon CG1_02_55_22]|nr:MAG: hypothetical protein AUJ14_03705 [Candidatus Micrarchaeota archaeon CG1_02_55_22]